MLTASSTHAWQRIPRSTAYLLLAIPWLPIWSKTSEVLGLLSVAALCSIVTLIGLLLCLPYRRVGRQTWLACGFALLLFVGLLPGSAPHLMEATTIRAFFSYGFFLCVLFVLSVLPQPRTLSFGIALGLCTAISLLGMIEFLAPKSVLPILEFFRTGESLTSIDNLGRAASIFTQRNIFGNFNSLLAVCALSKLINRQFDQVSAKWWTVVLICALGGALASTSKNAMVSMMVGGGFVFYSGSSPWVKRLMIGAATISVLLIAAALFSGPEYGTNKSTQVLIEEYSEKSPIAPLYFAIDDFSKGRLHIWKFWWNKKIKKKKWIWKGIGLGQFRNIHWSEQFNTHNTYVQFLFEGGLLGLLGLLMLVSFGALAAYRHGSLPIYCTFLTSFIFDHFFDYSALWAINSAWILLL